MPRPLPRHVGRHVLALYSTRGPLVSRQMGRVYNPPFLILTLEPIPPRCAALASLSLSSRQSSSSMPPKRHPRARQSASPCPPMRLALSGSGAHLLHAPAHSHTRAWRPGAQWPQAAVATSSQLHGSSAAAVLQCYSSGASAPAAAATTRGLPFPLSIGI